LFTRQHLVGVGVAGGDAVLFAEAGQALGIDVDCRDQVNVLGEGLDCLGVGAGDAARADDRGADLCVPCDGEALLCENVFSDQFRARREVVSSGDLVWQRAR
jgi:hypothetical protein